MQPKDIFDLARRHIELRALARYLPDVADRTLETVRELEREYASPRTVFGYRKVRTWLIRCELATYEFVSHLFSLVEITSRVTDRQYIRTAVDSRQPFRPLVGLRNAITHNGLVGFGLIMKSTSRGSTANVVCRLPNLRAHVDWDDSRARHGFDHYFGDLDGEAITIARSVLRGLRIGQETIVDLVVAIEGAVNRAGVRAQFREYCIANALNKTRDDLE